MRYLPANVAAYVRKIAKDSSADIYYTGIGRHTKVYIIRDSPQTSGYIGTVEEIVKVFMKNRKLGLT